jgi:predicted ribonuclease YlaK
VSSYIIDTNIIMGVENWPKFTEWLGPQSEKYILFEVLNELDANKWKEGEKAYKARRGIRHIERDQDNLTFINGQPGSSVDDQIIQTAELLGAIIVSNDVGLTLKARSCGVSYIHYKEYAPMHRGWTESTESAKPGDYIIERDEQGEVEQISRKESAGSIRPVRDVRIKSQYFPAIKPLDAYQSCALDSLKQDQITVLTGHAGTGKTLLSFAYALSELQSGHRRKIIIFSNPTKVRGAEELGFYSGDRTDKLLQNSIGAVLSSKLGDSMMIDLLLQQNKIEIFPVSDIRGFEVHRDDILYITEAQNLTTDLMKLVIQRCSEGTKVILEGDPETQLDSWAFEGRNNGLRRAVEVFSGFEGFGHVNLPVIRRSKIAEKAEEL